MADLDVRTKNILKGIEHTIDATRKHLDIQTHEAFVNTLSRAMTEVHKSYTGMKEGKVTPNTYGKVLIKLAEIAIMGVGKLPG